MPNEPAAVPSGYTIIRNLRGSWPNWFADLDNGQVVYVRIRHGEVSVGLGKDKDSAERGSGLVKVSPDFAGVTDAVDALTVLRERGFYYVAPTGDR